MSTTEVSTFGATPKADIPGLGDPGLFDSQIYEREDLRIDKVDGKTIHAIGLKFTGGVPLARAEPEDVSMFNRCQLGTRVRFVVEGTVTQVTTKGGGDTDDDPAKVGGERTVKIDTVEAA